MDPPKVKQQLISNGLIPVVSYESGVDIDDFGYTLHQCTIDEIIGAVRYVSSLPEPVLKKMSDSAFKYVSEVHIREQFSHTFEKNLRNILDIKG